MATVQPSTIYPSSVSSVLSSVNGSFWTYDNGHQLRASIAKFIKLYNFRRCHSTIYSAVSRGPVPDLNIKWEHLKDRPLRIINDICSEFSKVSVPFDKKTKIKNDKLEMTQAVLT